MMTEIKLDDHCRITYTIEDKPLRRYRYSYTTFNNLKFETHYDIYLSNVNFKDMFVVKSFTDDPVYFETFNDAVAYTLREMSKLKARTDEEQKYIQACLLTSNKKRKVKKDESKSV